MDYSKQWQEAVQKILAGNDNERSALVVSMYDPASINFLNRWPMYRDGQQVHIQNGLLFVDQLNEDFKLEKLFSYTGQRELLSEEGAKISEWSVPLQELQQYVNENNSIAWINS